jgi:hypothetical protein
MKGLMDVVYPDIAELNSSAPLSSTSIFGHYKTCTHFPSSLPAEFCEVVMAPDPGFKHMPVKHNDVTLKSRNKKYRTVVE